MKKPDFSKQGLSRFFLYHSEKLVLAVALLLLGLFFWLGFSSPVFDKKTPTQLTELARQADQYIVSEINWEKISEIDVRKADDKIVAKITEGSAKVDAAKYPFGFWSVKALTLGLRSDPALLEPQELMAFQMVAPVLFSPKATVVDPFEDLDLAKASVPSIDNDSRGMRDLGDLGDSPGDRRGGREDADEKKKKESQGPVIDAGSSVLALHQQTTPGLRPSHVNFSNTSEQAFIMNIVSITGLVNIKNQWTDYESSFASGIGFYPVRDKPKYLYVEVQRAEVIEGKEPEWQDISENVAVKQPSFYPNKMTRMPQASFPSAPEIISEDAWDNILTGPIPPIVQVDYRPMVTHPKIENRKFDPLPKIAKGKEVSDADTMFSDPATADGQPAQDDQNLPGLRDMGGPASGSPTRTDIVRSGSNVIKYKTALATKKALQDYKLLRFFDLQAKPGTTYQYRVRLWLADPNNEATGEDAVALRAGSPGRSGPGQAGGNRDLDDGGGMGQIGGGVGGLGGRGGRGGSEGEGGAPLGGPGAGQDAGDADAQYKHVAITSQMRDPLVRKRLDLARQVADPKDPKKVTYFVTEFRKTAEGEVSEEVQVPSGHDELRFARPTIWSQPVEVAVKSEMSSAIAGKVVPATKKKFGTFELAEGEPMAEVVATVLNKKYNAVLPAKKATFRAEALDFSANIHVVNSVTSGVHVYKQAPILTDSVVVDMLGGDELPLPPSEKMRFNLPGELLIMKADGTFQIANDLDDRTKFVQALLRDDDSMEVGGEKAERQRKREKEQEDNRRGAGGGESPGGRGGS